MARLAIFFFLLKIHYQIFFIIVTYYLLHIDYLIFKQDYLYNRVLNCNDMARDQITRYGILSYLPSLAEIALIPAAFILAMIILVLFSSTAFNSAAPAFFQ